MIYRCTDGLYYNKDFRSCVDLKNADCDAEGKFSANKAHKENEVDDGDYAYDNYDDYKSTDTAADTTERAPVAYRTTCSADIQEPCTKVSLKN